MMNLCPFLASCFTALTFAATSVNSTAQDIQEYQRQINILASETVNIQREFDHAHRERLTVEQNVQSLRAHLVELQQHLSEVTQTISKQTREILQNRLELSQTRLASLNTTLSRLQNREKKLQQSLTAKKQKKREVEQRFAQLDAEDHSDQQQEILDPMAELNALLIANSRLQANLTASLEAADAARAQTQALAKSTAQIQQKRASIEALLAAKASEPTITASQMVLDDKAPAHDDANAHNAILYLPQADKHYLMDEVKPGQYEVEVAIDAGQDRVYLDVQNQRFRSELPVSDQPTTYLFTLNASDVSSPQLEIRAKPIEQMVTNTDANL